jgi:hypothetical protein
MAQARAPALARACRHAAVTARMHRGSRVRESHLEFVLQHVARGTLAGGTAQA